MKLFLINTAKALLSAIYALLKLLPLRSRAVFISRQSDEPGIDFSMLRSELLRRDPGLEIKFLCKTMPKDFFGLFLYCFEILRQMYWLATSRLAVLDTYCIPVSVLHHRKELKVVQIWHALGAFKKFGLSTAGKAEGSDEKLAEAFAMHKNYDYVICSGERCRKPFAEAFGTDEKKVLPLGLPRMDYLSGGGEGTRALIYKNYPQLKNGKKTILYVPTFRRANGKNDYELADTCAQLKSAVDLEKFNLIIKTHSGSELICTESGESEGNKFLGMELLFAADAAITDYSSIVYEAALAKVPIYLWCPDLEDYAHSRGFYLDFPNDIPAFCSKDPEKVLDAVKAQVLPEKAALERFIGEFVSASNTTENLAQLCLSLLQ